MQRWQSIAFGVVLGLICVMVARTFGPNAAVAVGVVGILGLLLFVLARVRRGTAINNRGITLMDEGRVVQALALFEEAKPYMPRSPSPHYNIGIANLWLWRLDAAREAFEKTRSTSGGQAMRIFIVPSLLLISALQNDANRYAKTMDEIAKLDGARLSFVWIAKAVMAARAKQWREVLEALSLEHTRPLGGPARALADAMRSWATVEVGGQRLPIDAVGVLGETGTGSVKAWWPEFAAFLETATRA